MNLNGGRSILAMTAVNVCWRGKKKWKEKIYRIYLVLMESLFLPYILEKLFKNSSSM